MSEPATPGAIDAPEVEALRLQLAGLQQQVAVMRRQLDELPPMVSTETYERDQAERERRHGEQVAELRDVAAAALDTATKAFASAEA